MTVKGKKAKEAAKLEAAIVPIEKPKPGQQGPASLGQAKPKDKPKSWKGDLKGKGKKEQAKEAPPAEDEEEKELPPIPPIIHDTSGLPAHVRREVNRLERRVRQAKRRLARGIDVRKQQGGHRVSEKEVVETLVPILKEMQKTKRLVV
jgi:hypothetical protein